MNLSFFKKPYITAGAQKFTLWLFALFICLFIVSDKSDIITLLQLAHTPKPTEALVFLLLCTCSYFFIGKSVFKSIFYACLWSIYFLTFAGHYQIGDPGYYDAFVYNDLSRSIGSEFFSISLFHGLLYFFGFHLEGITLTLSFLGGIYIFFVLRLINKQDTDKLTSMIIFCLFVSAGMLLTFFRDGEVYTLMTLFGLMLIFSLYRRKNVSIISGILLASAIALHHLALLFVPLYLLKLTESRKKLLNIVTVILSYFIIDHFFRYSALFGGLPLVGGSSLVNFFTDDFSLKSYLWERTGMLFFICPAWPIALVCLFTCIRNKESISLFSFALLYPFLIFILFFDFVYSVTGDYNLYVLGGFGIVFFFSECLLKGFSHIKTKSLKTVTALLIVLSIFVNFQIVSYRADRSDTDWDNLLRNADKKETKGNGLIHSDKLIGFINRKDVAKLNLKHEANQLWYTFLRTFFTQEGLEKLEADKSAKK